MIKLNNKTEVPKELQTLRSVRDIEWFDGPLLTEFQGEDNEAYTCKWVDVDVGPWVSVDDVGPLLTELREDEAEVYACKWFDIGVMNRWLFVRTSQEDLLAYEKKKKTFLDIYSKQPYVYFCDIDSHGNIIFCYKYLVEEIPDHYK